MMFAIVTTVWQRLELTTLMLRHTKEICSHRNDILFYAVGSEFDQSKRVVEAEGWNYIESPNEPLNEKWNNVIQALPRDIEGVIVLGSDDFISRAYLDKILNSTYDFCGSNNCYFLDLPTHKGYHFYYENKANLIGAGLFLSKKVLNELNWSPWAGKPLNAGLDGRLIGNVYCLKLKKHVFSDVGEIIDIKGAGVNITRLSIVAALSKEVDVWSILANITSASIFNELENLSSTLRNKK